MKTNYEKLYRKIFKIMGEVTPLYVNCGQLCNCACCKGDENTGMRLFPFEGSTLKVKELPENGRLAVCNGTCNRATRPLACRIFPFFPTIDEKGKIYVELDFRAARLCPILKFYDDLQFNPKFFKAVKKVGNLLKKDEATRKFLIDSTEEIDNYRTFFDKK